MKNNTRLVTLHLQKDGRTCIGTAVHLYKDCPSLKSRTGVREVNRNNELIQHLPKCYYCFNLSLNRNTTRSKNGD